MISRCDRLRVNKGSMSCCACHQDFLTRHRVFWNGVPSFQWSPVPVVPNQRYPARREVDPGQDVRLLLILMRVCGTQ